MRALLKARRSQAGAPRPQAHDHYFHTASTGGRPELPYLNEWTTSCTLRLRAAPLPALWNDVTNLARTVASPVPVIGLAQCLAQWPDRKRPPRSVPSRDVAQCGSSELSQPLSTRGVRPSLLLSLEFGETWGSYPCVAISRQQCGLLTLPW